MGKTYKLKEKFSVPFDLKIRGFGEIYEIESVEYLRKNLWLSYGQEYHDAILYLEPRNEKQFRYQFNATSDNDLRETILDAGGTDRPFWKCNPKLNGKPPNRILMGLARLVFKILVRFENKNLWKGEPHISYILLKGEIK